MKPAFFPAKYRPHLLAFLVAAVFANSFWGVFVFDEYSSITRNETIRHFWPLDCMFAYPNNTRPVIGLSFAINYAIHQNHFWSYHLLNFAIHIVSALALYGIALRTFLSARLAPRFGRDAANLSFLIALIWAVHPLQTASVTYVVQRCESLMGMFFLLTLYSAIRSAEIETDSWWNTWAILFCALGMGTKQVMVAAPPLVLLYDRTFLSGTLAEAIKKRATLYAGLFASCMVLATTALDNPPQGPSAGFSIRCVTPYHYLLTQCAVIPHYLSLTFWPKTLCLDYVWPFTTAVRDVWPGLLLLSILGLATLYAVVRNSAWGFVGAWFFVILAPSSSIMPIQDPIFEHRMYLPLAAVVVVCVLVVHAIAQSLLRFTHSPRFVELSSSLVFAMIALALSVRTVLRNTDYYHESTIWRKVAELYPNSQRATNNLGNALAVEENHVEAVHWFEECERINPNYADAQFNLGVELNNLGRKEEAIRHYQRALELNPAYQNAHGFMADILVDLGRVSEAIPHYEMELNADPKRDDLRKKLDEALDALELD